ncbi:hypothetical protein OAD55_01050 [Planktomarina temperata]|nr:hypothetical protein [Planktomarina temperata]
MIEYRRIAFFMRAYNDIDHFSPVIAEFVKRNENPVIVFTSDIDFENDYRIKFLRTLGNFEVFMDVDKAFDKISNNNTFIKKLFQRFYKVKRNPKTLIGKCYRRFFHSTRKQFDFLHEKSIAACVFEWSTPFDKGEVIEKYFIAATGIGITTIAIPHGCNVFINSDVNVSYRKMIKRGKLIDQSDRALYDYFVLQNPIRRLGWIKWGLDPVKTQAWGSARFYPDWAMMNKNICPKFNPKIDHEGKLKVVFMQFQKDYNLHNELIMQALQKLSQIEYLSLVVKDATREGKAYYDRESGQGKLGPALVGWYGNDVHSPALIDWADCVIVIGGSIGVEVILQKKKLIYPTYLNSNLTMYEYFDAAYCASDFQEIEQLLELFHTSENVKPPPGAEEMMTEIVYAGEKPFNVPLRYYENIKNKSLAYRHRRIEQ